jgi:cobalamin biosynthesis protein CobT
MFTIQQYPNDIYTPHYCGNVLGAKSEGDPEPTGRDNSSLYRSIANMVASASVQGNNNEVDDDSETEGQTSDDETDDDESDEETVTSDEDTDSGEEMSSDAASDIGNEEKEAVPIYECSTPYHCIVCSEVVTQDRNPDKPCGRTKYIMDFKKRCRRCR